MWVLLVLLSTFSSESDEVIPSFCLEYQITVPVDVNDFQMRHLYTVAEFSKAKTGGGEGVEVLDNDPMKKGRDGIGKNQYTHKLLYLQTKVPDFLIEMSPDSSLEIHEISYNAHPRSVTYYKNLFMRDKFYASLYHVAYDSTFPYINILTLVFYVNKIFFPIPYLILF